MRRAVLFDFDGTLVRGDSAGRYLRDLIASSPLRQALALAGLPLLPPAFGWWRSARALTSAYLWLATVGRDEAALRSVRERFIAGCVDRRENLLIAPAVDRLRRHLDAGDEVVIVTGASESLAQELWQALEGPPVTALVGSILRRGFGGQLAERHCFGPRKLDALAQAGVRPPFAAVYTDSARDLPLLRCTDRPVLVEPSGRTIRRVRRALGEVEVL